MNKSPMFDVFLSYSRSDAPAVEALAISLREADQHVWFDQWELPPGQVWEETLREAIRTSSDALVCIGPSGVSAWQQEELRSVLGDDQAEEPQHAVIPVLLPGANPAALPRSLRNFNP